MFLLIFLTLFLYAFPAWSFDIECCEGTYKVEARLPTSGNIMVWCQKEEEGKPLKHGNYKLFSERGGLVAMKYFLNDEEVTDVNTNFSCDKKEEGGEGFEGPPQKGYELPDYEKLVTDKNKVREIVAKAKCPSSKFESNVNTMMLGAFPDFIDAEICDYKKGFDLILKRDYFYINAPFEILVRANSCLKSPLKLHTLAKRAKVYMRSAEHCYLMETKPISIKLAQKGERFKDPFYSQPWPSAVQMQKYPKYAKAKKLVALVNTLPSKLSKRDKESFSEAKELLENFLNSKEAHSIDASIRSLDEQIRKLVY